MRYRRTGNSREPEGDPLENVQQHAVARELFTAWTGVGDPDTAGALWYNLSDSDRKYWLDLAQERKE
jgi:hypothetical protein